jgi:hypothetical protein
MKADLVTLRMQVMDNSKNGEIIGQIKKTYKYSVKKSRTLIAILDIEAVTLNQIQRKAFSDFFRSLFIGRKELDITSGADIDKLNPDAIQEASGCTRDECATIIGEQLGVDRVVSTTIYKLSKDLFFISSKLINIVDGSILASKSVEFNGDLKQLKPALKKLVSELIKQLRV